jgi:hypothetical protein
MPAETDRNWAAPLNSNTLLIDSMFSGCALNPLYGGTGSKQVPQDGDILVGGEDGNYHVFGVGPSTYVLTADADEDLGVKWAPIAPPGDGAPTEPTCDATTTGVMRLDTTNHRLYICAGVTREWDFVPLIGKCCGDCDRNDSVSDAEVAICAAISAGTQLLQDCPQCDCNFDGEVVASEVTTAVINEAQGCPGLPTFTPTP